eukprot:SAG25_NODE_2301_length_1740_cov_5.232176_2_plen_253_part_01
MRPDDLDAEISPGGGGLQSMLSQHQLVADAQMEFGGLLSEYRWQQAQQVPPQPEAKTASEARAPQPAQPAQPAQQQPPPQPALQPEAVADSGGQAQPAWSGGPVRTGSAVDVLQKLRQQEDTAPLQLPLPSQHASAGQWVADPSGGRDVTAPPPVEDEAELDGSSRMSALQDEHARWQEQMAAEIAAAESRQRQPAAAVTRGGGSGLEEELDSESVWRTRSGGGVDDQHHDGGGGGGGAGGGDGRGAANHRRR